MLLKEDLPRPPLTLGGAEIMRLSRNESFDLVFRAAASLPVRIAWIYANCINIIQKNKPYQQAAEEIEFLLNDGAGIELASKALGAPVVENLCGTDWIPEFFNRASTIPKFKRVYLLGTTAENIETAASNFQNRWPELKLVGFHQGYLQDSNDVLEDIALNKPDILILGLGVPLQEIFLREHWKQLTGSGLKIAVAGGAILDHLADAVIRAPLWMQRIRM